MGISPLFASTTIAAPQEESLRPPTPTPLWTDAPRARAGRAQPLLQDTFETIAAAAAPGVVNIEVELHVGIPQSQGVAMGQGTGFFIHRDGFIVTNAHVVGRAHTIRVTTSDRRTFDAEVVGLDPETDIALIAIQRGEQQVPREGFPVLRLADSDAVRVGQWVLAIGNPYGLSHTTTAGIVSSVGRRDLVEHLRLRYADFIQIDAAINLGNSGGPLLDLQGNVVGMNTAIQSGNDIGFSIPSNMIRQVLPALGEGEVRRSWAGVVLEDLSADDARNQPNGRQGAKVRSIAQGGPADKAGLKAGDIILRFDDREVEDSAQLRWFMASAPEGHQGQLHIRRGETSLRPRIVLEARPAEEGARTDRNPMVSAPPVRSTPPAVERPAGPAALGVVVAELSDEQRAQLPEATKHGVMVLWVDQGSAASFAGIQPGDVITHLNEQAIASPPEFLARAETAKSERRISLRVMRGRIQIFLFVSQS